MSRRVPVRLLALSLGLLAGASLHAQTARIFFIDVGQGSATLIVGPTGKTLLVDGGPNGAGSGKIVPLLNTLGIATVDYAVLTHYHLDHDQGLTEVINAGRLSGIAYDNGDGVDVVPPTVGGTTWTGYSNYLAAISARSATVTRQTLAPGTVLDLGGGMRATCLVNGGKFLSGATIPVTPDDLNTASIGLLIQYDNFSFLIAGDLTGGGATSAARTLDLESTLAQLAGDVELYAADHHGSLTGSNRRFLRALKAEAMVASMGETNSFGHPAREIANRYLHTPASSGAINSTNGVPPAGSAPVFYQTEASPASGSVSAQGYSGAAPGAAGNGTLRVQTDGLTTFTIQSFDDGGARINPAVHLYPLDSANGITGNFPPTVIASISPVVPTSFGAVTVSAKVNDREDPIGAVTLDYSLNGVAQAPVAMTLSGGVHQASVPAQANGTKVDLSVSATAGGATTVARLGYFAGITPISAIATLDAEGEPVALDHAVRVRATVSAGTGVFSAGPDRLEALEDGSGVMLFYASTSSFGGPTATCSGQLVDATGRVAVKDGQLLIDMTPDFATVGNPYFVSLVSSGADPVPLDRTAAQLAAFPELYEGRLVRVTNAMVTSGTIPAAPATFDAFLAVNDGTGSFSMKIFRESDLPGLATPSAPFALTGVVTQDDGLRPFTSSYSVAPRHRADLGAPPLIPSFVTAQAGTANVTVTWENVLQSGSYRIERSAAGCPGPWSAVTTRYRTSGATNFYTDTTVSAGTPYCYRIVPLTDACGGGTPTSCNGSTACALPVAGTGGVCAPAVVISQVLGGGGNSGAPYQNDFIELHNRSAGSVSLAGWAVQYASAGGTGGWSVTALSGSIPAGGYYLVQEAAGAGSGVPLPAPDATGGIALSATGGKIALTNSTSALSGACPATATIVDQLGYSLGANCFETAPIGSLSATTAALRKAAACTDTQNNSADFQIAAPAPRNSATAALTCNCSNPPPVEVSSAAGGLPLRVRKNGDGSLALDFEELPDATGYNLYAGGFGNFYSHGASGANQCATATTSPVAGLRRATYPSSGPAGYFLVTGYNAVGEGTAGFSLTGGEIPPLQNSCAP